MTSKQGVSVIAVNFMRIYLLVVYWYLFESITRIALVLFAYVLGGLVSQSPSISVIGCLVSGLIILGQYNVGFIRHILIVNLCTIAYLLVSNGYKQTKVHGCVITYVYVFPVIVTLHCAKFLKIGMNTP